MESGGRRGGKGAVGQAKKDSKAQKEVKNGQKNSKKSTPKKAQKSDLNRPKNQKKRQSKTQTTPTKVSFNIPPKSTPKKPKKAQNSILTHNNYTDSSEYESGPEYAPVSDKKLCFVIVAPFGFIDFEEFETYCSELDFGSHIGYSGKGSRPGAEVTLKLCSPEEIPARFSNKKFTKNTFLISIFLEDEDLETIKKHNLARLESEEGREVLKRAKLLEKIEKFNLKKSQKSGPKKASLEDNGEGLGGGESLKSLIADFEQMIDSQVEILGLNVEAYNEVFMIKKPFKMIYGRSGSDKVTPVFNFSALDRLLADVITKHQKRLNELPEPFEEVEEANADAEEAEDLDHHPKNTSNEQESLNPGIPLQSPILARSVSDNTRKEPTTIFETSTTSKETSYRTEVIVLAFYGLSCLGKSHFCDYLKNHLKGQKMNLEVVSSDECAAQALEEYFKTAKNVSQKAAMKKTRNQRNDLFERYIEAFLTSVKPGRNLLVLDKVSHSQRFFKNLQKKFSNISLKLIALYPKNHNERFKISSRKSLPFSLSLILNICARMLNRQNHATVPENASERLHLALSFFLMYKNVQNIPQAKQKDGEFWEFYGVPFHRFSPRDNIPGRFGDLLRKILGKLKMFDEGDKAGLGLCEELAGVLGDGELEQSGCLGYAKEEDWEQLVHKIVDQFEVDESGDVGQKE